jgi:glycosyltransferase involved in cell wall biosynthesis
MIWPLDKPAVDVVKLPATGPTPAWAVFDATWYRARYVDAVRLLPDPSDQGLLAFYLGEGQRLAHAPNPWFDEVWYRRVHPAVGPMLERGEVASGFDHYCRQGNCLDRRPHWLFDERLYRRRNPDLTDDILQERRLANGYDHYLRNGNREGRHAHALFDAAYFLSQFDPETVRQIREIGAYRFYLTHVGTFAAEPRTSPYFDPDWYLRTYPAAAQSVATGTYRSALEHYLCNETPERFDPLSDFSEAWYRATYPDVATAIEERQFRNGYVHFLLNGARECRTPSAAIDLQWYAEQEPARLALQRREVPDPFVHWLRIGSVAGLPSRPPAPEEPEPPADPSAPAATTEPDAALLPLFGRLGVNFTCVGEPAVSVVMILHNHFAAAIATLGALRQNFAGDLDMILVDRGSGDECRHIGRYVTGAQHIRFESAIDERAARNAALHCARAERLLFIAPDARPAFGAIDRALRRLTADPTIGAVCGITCAASGLVADAGGRAWDDGTLEWIARGSSPLAPAVNTLRDVDFAPPHFLLARTDILTETVAFDERMPDLIGAAADLGLRLRARDLRVVCDPAIVVYRPDAGEQAEAGPDMAEGRAALADRHRALLAARPDDPVSRIWPINRTARRVLYIDDSVPLRITGSGFVRSNDVIHAMAEMGYAVTVFPVLGCRFNLAAVYADMPETVEVLHDHALSGLRAFLADRPGHFDAIWISRTHNLDLVAPILASFGPAGSVAPRLILDTEAIAAERQHARLALTGIAFDLPGAIAQELARTGLCDHVIAVSERDAAVLRRSGLANVSVLGHIRTPTPTPRRFTSRNGLLFVGAIHEQESPDYDSLCWFVDNVLPLVERALGWETRLTIVGYTAPNVSMNRFADHPRVTLRGTVPDLVPLYDSHRLFVAPTRFAAGSPYKVHEAASFGLPVVASALLASQLGWRDGEALLVAPTDDAERMAERIVTLYRDEALWQRLRDGALARLVAENSPGSYRQPLLDALGSARRDGTGSSL